MAKIHNKVSEELENGERAENVIYRLLREGYTLEDVREILKDINYYPKSEQVEIAVDMYESKSALDKAFGFN